MKTFLTVISILAILAGTANAATIKVVWNQPLDSAANVAANARVTSAPSLVCPGFGDCIDEKGDDDRTQRRIDAEEEEKKQA